MTKRYNSTLAQKIIAAAKSKPVASFKTLKEYQDWVESLDAQ